MGNELVVRNEMSLMDLGKALASSGYFSDAKQAAQAVVKVLAGQELGFGPIASMTGIHIVNGKPVIGGDLMAAKIKGSSVYDYDIVELTNAVCRLGIIKNGKEMMPTVEFTIEDAKRAGLTTGKNAHSWKHYPRNMLFNRAISNAKRWHCPELFAGLSVYTPEELGAPVDDTGAIIDGPKWEEVTEEPAPETRRNPVLDYPEVLTAKELETPETPVVTTETTTEAKPAVRPYDPETLKKGLGYKIEDASESHQSTTATESQSGLVAGKLEECFAPQIDAVGKRKAVLMWLTDSDSTKDISMATASALLDWLLDKDASPGTYDLHPAAPEEARRVLAQAEADAKEAPQEEDIPF